MSRKMQCYFLVLLLVSVGGAYGSIVELNDTLLEWFPPLYALDDWAACQRPMDQYCLVDAVLRSRDPSPLLDALKEYSNQTGKHFNRTMVHRAVCVTQCPGNSSDTMEAAQNCVNQSIQPYQLEAEVLSTQYCRTAGNQRASGAARAFGVIMITLVILTIVATGVSMVDYKMGNKVLMAFSLKKNWAVLTHTRSKPKSESRLKDFSFFDGIKVFGIQGVIFTHVIITNATAYSENPEFIEKMYDQLPWKLLMNSPILLQGFFVMSGFITAFTLLIVTEKRKLTLGACLYSVLNRWIRLTPPVIFALWFTMAWFPLLGSGPHWSWMVDREASHCFDVWWYYLFYAQNYIGTQKFCMGHLWYLAADMQFHIIGLLVLFVLLRFRRLVLPVVVTLIAASSIASGLVIYIYNLDPIVAAQPPEVLRTLFQNWEHMSKHYIPVWMSPGFFCGVLIGFIHYNNQQEGIKLNEKKWFNILHHLSTHLCNVVVASGVFFLSDNRPPLWAAAVYSMFDRTLTAILFSIFMLGLANKCQPPLMKFFSWRGFAVLGKLSYSVYIIHFIVLRVVVGSDMHLRYSSVLSMLCLWIVTTILSYIASIPLFLMIESPMIQMWKALFELPRPAPAPVEPATIKIEQQVNNQNEDVK